VEKNVSDGNPRASNDRIAAHDLFVNHDAGHEL
jgi:hypothetical protein